MKFLEGKSFTVRIFGSNKNMFLLMMHFTNLNSKKEVENDDDEFCGEKWKFLSCCQNPRSSLPLLLLLLSPRGKIESFFFFFLSCVAVDPVLESLVK